MFMQAVVIESGWDQLLVLDLDTRQQVVVHTPQARMFRPGEQVMVWYSGAMTNSIPPQITALRIQHVPGNGLQPMPPVQPPCRPDHCPPVFFLPVVRPPMFRPPVGRPPHRPQPPRRPGNRNY